jgi:hypothetical protein
MTHNLILWVLNNHFNITSMKYPTLEFLEQEVVRQPSRVLVLFIIELEGDQTYFLMTSFYPSIKFPKVKVVWHI